MENGVEVVINHLEPYSLPGVPSKLTLEEIFSIDTEKEEIVKTGLTNIETFAVAPSGEIFIMMRESHDNFIYRFDSSGKFLNSFGRKGQGPGEFEYGGGLLVDDDRRIIAKDMTQDKYSVFSEDGALIKEVRLDKNISILKLLGNGNVLTLWQESDPESPVIRNHFCVSNEILSENMEFYMTENENPFRSKRYVPNIGSLCLVDGSLGNVILGDSSKGYEIAVLDQSGKPLRKIRKAFRPIPFPQDYVALAKKSLSRSPIGLDILRKLSVPAQLPPFRYLFTDDRGRLYVMTHERDGERHYWYDVFSEQAAFIGRFKLDNVQVTYFEDRRFFDTPTAVLVKGDRLYYVRESPDGFMALAVYRMVWN